MATEAFAPAKINLSLHVTGRRADGYHLLDSLVVFADVGDRVSASLADELTLRIDGPQGAGLSAGEDNLVMRAARLMSAAAGGFGAALTLHKALPVASGIGGGSADAAATLRVLSRLWSVPLPPRDAVLGLGADVTVCLEGRATRMSGIGEVLSPVPYAIPKAVLVLVNPGVEVPTPAVFAALDRRDNAPMPRDLPRLSSVADLAAFLSMTRNDLERAAIGLQPAIGQARMALSGQPGCRIARMSGSGATCFGLFDDGLQAAAAVRSVAAARPDWWVVAAPLRDA